MKRFFDGIKATGPAQVAAAAVVLVLAGCGGGPAWSTDSPRGIDEPLAQGALADAGLPATQWESAVADAQRPGLRIDQLALMVGGRRLAVHHAAGHGEASLHDLRSATKSITSLLVGIAIDRGLIAGVDARVDDFFPERPPHASRRDAALTLAHLLTMRSGLECDDWDPASPGNEERMYRSADWIVFFQQLHLRETPGTRFSYCTAGVVVLGEIVARAAGRPLPEFARDALFEPLGIGRARWALAPGGVTDAGGHLHLSLDSMLKIGELMRLEGRWQGRQVVSREWVRRSVQSTGLITSQLQAHEGLLWWLEPVRDGIARSFQARGNGGQLIIVIPEFELVVAATGHAWGAAPEVQWAPFQIVERWFLPTLRERAAAPSGR